MVPRWKNTAHVPVPYRSASVDCVRLWNTADLWNPESNMKKSKSGVPFRIVAGHHGGTVSKIRQYSLTRQDFYHASDDVDFRSDIDPTGQYMVTATGNRGWAGDATKVVLVHERK
jgi:transcriptional activator SPT8